MSNLRGLHQPGMVKEPAARPKHGFTTLHRGPTSAECIRDIFACHWPVAEYERLSVLDLTFGLGTFWNKWNWLGRGISMTTNDLFTPANYCWNILDYMEPPLTPLGTGPIYDIVVFDPPHSAIGTPSKKGGGGEWAARYGAARHVPGAPKNYQDILKLTIAGTRLACRMAKLGVIVKTQPAVEFGKWGHTPYYVEREIMGSQLDIDGWWLMETSRWPQPSGRPQRHPRNVLSVYLVGKIP